MELVHINLEGKWNFILMVMEKQCIFFFFPQEPDMTIVVHLISVGTKNRKRHLILR